MLRESGALAALAVALAIIVTWPVASELSTHLLVKINDPDLQVGLWWPYAVADSLFEGNPIFYRQEFAWPDGQDTRLLLWNVGAQLIYAPLARFADPVTTINTMTLTSMALNGLVAGLAARWMTGSRAAAVTAVAIGATSAYAFLEGGTGRPEQALWAPIALYLAGIVQLRTQGGSRKTILICAASLAAAGAIYWFYAYFLVVTTVILAAGWLWKGALGRRTLIDLSLVGVGSLVLVSPFMVPILSAVIEDRAFFESMQQHGGDTVNQQARAALLVPWSFLGPRIINPEQSVALAGSTHTAQLAPILSIPVIVFMLWKEHRPARLLAWVVLLGLLMAAGPVLQTQPGKLALFGNFGIRLPMAVLNILPGFSRLWWPYRWLGVVIPALALALAWAVSRSRRPWLFSTVISAVFVAESVLLLRGLIQASPDAPNMPAREAFAAMARMEGDRPVIHMPLVSTEGSPNMVGFAAWHQQPIDGGIAWNIGEVRTDAYQQRRIELPILSNLQKVQHGVSTLDHQGPWTEDETGGFHYVVLFPGASQLDGILNSPGYLAALGLPFFCNDEVAIWAIPGVGEVPPEYAGVPESDQDPCLR